MTDMDPIDDATTELFRGLVEAATDADVSVAVAESLTGGLFGFLVSREPGAGNVLVGSLVTYRSSVKRELLGVPEGPVVSAVAARVMAESAYQLLDSDLAVSLTGVAGPARQEGRPVGTVFVGTAGADHPPEAHEHHLDGSPDAIRLAACRAAARHLIELIQA